MGLEDKQPTQTSLTELLRNSNEFDEAQATEVGRRIGYDLANQLSNIGLDQSLLVAFREKVVRPLEVQLNPDTVSSRFEFGPPFSTEESDEAITSVMAIGGVGLKVWATVLNDALTKVGFQEDYEGQILDLTFGWMISHELGHGLGDAKSYLQRTVSVHDPSRWVYEPSTYDYLDQHPAENMKPEDESSAVIIEGERRAEGVAVIFCQQLLEEAGLDTDTAATVISKVHQTFALRLDEQPKNINLPGYAKPLSAEQLIDRFQMQLAA